MREIMDVRLLARVGSKALIREINEALVLDVVRRSGTTSRAEITSVTGLSPATVTGISSQLVRDGLLVESDVLRGTGGRPARLIELGRDAIVAAGVRLSPDAVEVARGLIGDQPGRVELGGGLGEVPLDALEIDDLAAERGPVAHVGERLVEGRPGDTQ